MRGVINGPAVIYLAFFPMILVDAVNGWMVRSFSVSASLSQVYKMVVISGILLWLAKRWQFGFIMALGYLTIALAIVFLHTSDYADLSELVEDFGISMKLGTAFILFLFLKRFFQRVADPVWAERWFWKIVSFSYVVVAVNIAFGIFGIGFTTSRFVKGYGGLGFFKAGNDVSSTFLVISGLLLYRVWSSGKTGRYVLFGIFTLVLALFLQTKTVIAGMGILLCGIPVIVSYGRMNRRAAFLLLLGGFSFGTAITWLIQKNVGLVQRFVFYYEKSGLLFALFMGRNYFSGMAAQVIETKSSLMDIMWGHGWNDYLQKMGSFYVKEKLVEIDYVDVFMINGVVGITVVLAIWISFLLQARSNARFHVAGRVAVFMNLLLLGIAGTAGHIFYSGLNGPFIALLNALPFLVLRQQEEAEETGSAS